MDRLLARALMLTLWNNRIVRFRQLMLLGLFGTIFRPFETTIEGMPESQVMMWAVIRPPVSHISVKSPWLAGGNFAGVHEPDPPERETGCSDKSPRLILADSDERLGFEQNAGSRLVI